MITFVFKPAMSVQILIPIPSGFFYHGTMVPCTVVLASGVKNEQWQ